MVHASTSPAVRQSVPTTKVTGNTTLATNTVNGGVHNGDFSIGSGSKTTDGFIGAEAYGWGVARTSAGGATITASYATRLGETVMRMVVAGISKSGSTIAQLGVYSTGVYSASSLALLQQKHLIPVTAGDTYRVSWRQYIETINDVAHVDLKTNSVFYDSSLARVASTHTYSADYTLGKFVERSYTVVAPVTSTYVVVSPIALGKGTDFTGGDVTWEVTNVRVEKVSSVTNAGAFAAAYLPALQAVTSVDSIDQNLDPTGAYANTYTVQTAANEGATHRQTFVPTKDNCSLLSVKIVDKGTGNWGIVIHDSSNNAVGGGTASISNATLTNGQFYSFPVAGKFTVGQTYHIHVLSSVADGTIATNTASDCEDCSYVMYYGKKTDGILVRNAAGETMKIDPGVDGLLHNSIIDLNDSKFKYRGKYQQSTSSVANVPFYLDVSAASGYTNNYYTFAFVNGLAVPQSAFWTMKVNTIFPMTSFQMRLVLGIAATRSCKLSYSYDNSTFFDAVTYDSNDDSKQRYWNVTPTAGTTVLYIRMTSISSTTYVTQMDITASLDLRSLGKVMLPAGASNIYLSAPSSFDDATKDPSEKMVVSYARIPITAAGTARTAAASRRFRTRETASPSGIRFTGSNEIKKIGILTEFSTKPYSFIVRCKAPLNASNVAGDQQTIIGSGNVTPYFYLALRNSNYMFRYQDAGEDRQAITPQLPGRSVHLVAISDPANSRIRLYLNSVLKHTVTVTSFLDLLSTDFKSGFLTGQTAYGGLIEEIIAFKDKVLSQEEIDDHYYDGYVPKDGILLNWPLDTDSGTEATDVSGNENHGTITGATWDSQSDSFFSKRTQT